MLVPMSKVQIIGAKECMMQTVHVLYRLGVFQIEEPFEEAESTWLPLTKMELPREVATEKNIGRLLTKSTSALSDRFEETTGSYSQ